MLLNGVNSSFRHLLGKEESSRGPSMRRIIKKTSLRIAIVNRPGGRTLLNPVEAQKSIREAFPDHDVVLHYFNGTAQEMVDFYHQVDVLISPHGSQLTGIMFMRQCSGVLELFPHLYYTQYYFSSLARLFNLTHANWYISNGTVPQSLDLKTRLANTNNNMCPSLDKLVLFVRKMIEQRHECLSGLELEKKSNL